MKHRAVVVAAVLASALTASAAAAADITLTGAHLTGANLAVPPFYPNSLATVNAAFLGNTRQAEAGDTLTVIYSEQMLASTLCTGTATSVGTRSFSATVTITSNGAPSGNDQLGIASVGTLTCPGDGILHFGTVDLGSPAYVTSGTASFILSTVALTQTATSATISITLGVALGSASVRITAGTSAIYTPDPALTDTAGKSIGLSTALSTATTQF